MLTKKDLAQIGEVVEKGFKNEISPLNNKISSIDNKIYLLAKDFKTLREDVSKIRKDIGTIVNFFDNEYLELRKRVERIEHHLKLPSVV